jgi:hypothetical protein
MRESAPLYITLLILWGNSLGIGGICPNLLQLNDLLIFENGDRGAAASDPPNKLVFGQTGGGLMFWVKWWPHTCRAVQWTDRDAKPRSRVKNRLIRMAAVILPLPIGFFLWQTAGVQSWGLAMLLLFGAAFCANSVMEK